MNKKIENLEIIDYTHQGLGIAKHLGEVIFVEEVLIGEVVDVEVYGYIKKIAHANVLNIVEKSPDRIEPRCEYFSKCGGCNLQHMNIKAQLDFKKRVILNLAKKQKFEVNSNDLEVVKNPKEFGYRNKVVLTFVTNDNEIYLGFNKSKTKDVININNCLLISDNMNQAHKSILKQIRATKKQNKDLDLEMFKKLTIRENQKGELLVLLELNNMNLKTRQLQLLGQLEQNIIEKMDIVSFNLEYNKKIIKKQTHPFMYILGDKKFVIDAKSFFQVNKEQTINMYEDVKKHINKNHKNILDAYSGVGSIGIYVKEDDQNLVSVEIIKSAVKNAKTNSHLNDSKKTRFLCLDLEKDLQKIKDKNEFLFDTVILDPPRKGISKKLINILNEENPKEIIYISCSMQSLIRDLKLLEDNYKLTYIKAYDMFSQTTHIEFITKLEKSENSTKI